MADLNLSLQFSETNDAVAGTVTDGKWTAPLFGLKPGLYNAVNQAPEMGTYRLRFTNAATFGFSSGEEGSGKVTVSAGGTIRFSGVLPDGSAFAQSTVMFGGGNWPVFVSLYSGKGLVSGWIAFSNSLTTQLSGSLNWVKTGPMGFTNVLTAVGSDDMGLGAE